MDTAAEGMGPEGRAESIYSSNTHPSCQEESKAGKEGTEATILPHTWLITVRSRELHSRATENLTSEFRGSGTKIAGLLWGM